MQITIEYTNQQEREQILEEHQDKYLIEIEEKNITEGNFLVFSTVKPIESEIDDLKQAVAELSIALSEVM